MTATSEDTIKNILSASPPGQFDIIVEDLRFLLPKSLISLLEPTLVSTARSKWEASTGRSTLGDAANGAGSEFIASLSKAMDDHLSLNFSSPGVRAAHVVTAATLDGTPTFMIATYAERIDLHNHRAGSWKGCYTIRPSSGDIGGDVSVCAHTFENGGNVQLHSDITLDVANVGKCSASDGIDKQSAWAKAVTRQIELWEDGEVMLNLSHMYESMGNTYLKSLRRVMPITRTKMEWNVMAHRVVQTLGEGHSKDKFKH